MTSDSWAHRIAAWLRAQPPRLLDLAANDPERLASGLCTMLTFLVMTYALTEPLLAVKWLPFVDYPQHIGAVAAIHGRDDPTFSRYFVVNLAQSQYLSLYLMGDWLAYPLGVEAATRWTAIASIVSLPLAVAALLRAHDRPVLSAALAAPLAYHAYVFWGFLNYAAGMSAAVFTVAAAAEVAKRPSWPRAFVLAVCALVTFYTHAQLYAWMGLACATQLMTMVPTIGWRRAFRAALASLLAAIPSGLGLILWLRASNVLERGEAGDRSGHATELAAASAAPIFKPVLETARAWLSHSFDVYSDGAGITIAVAFFGAALVLITFRGTRARVWDAPRPPAHSLAPEAVLILTVFLYLFAPFSYRMIEPISHRFLPLAFALVAVLGPRQPLRWPAFSLLSVILCALSIHVSTIHRSHFESTDVEMGELAATLERTVPGRRLLGLIYDANSSVVSMPVYLHSHQYYQALVGGLACFSFVEFPKSPVHYAEDAAPPPFPPRFEWTPQSYDHAIWGDAFDYWLVRGPRYRRSPQTLFRGADPAPELVFESEHWALFRRPETAPGSPAGESLDTANSEPANSEPANSEPANSEPANSEPANSEPANAGPRR